MGRRAIFKELHDAYNLAAGVTPGGQLSPRGGLLSPGLLSPGVEYDDEDLHSGSQAIQPRPTEGASPTKPGAMGSTELLQVENV